MQRPAEARAGFTLVEILVALAILMAAMAVVWGAFTVTLSGWTRSRRMLDEMRHGDFVLEQLVSALRSAAFMGADRKPGLFGFRLTDRGGRYSADTLSWVTSSSAFLPPDSPLHNSLHRLSVGIGEDAHGQPAVTVTAWPYLLEEDEVKNLKPGFVSSEVRGLNCRVYDFEGRDWTDEWQNTNLVPAVVEITLFMDPPAQGTEPVKLQRLVEIPLGVTNANQVIAIGQPPVATNAPGPSPTNQPARALMPPNGSLLRGGGLRRPRDGGGKP